MVSSLVFPSLLAMAHSWPTRTYQHFYHAVGDFSTYPTAYPTGFPTESSGAYDATYSNTAGVSWLPGTEKVRGVNLGSHFIIEPWTAYDEWNSMGCGDVNDEWQCVKKLGQEAADAVFAKHWDTWTSQEDIANISSLGLNVIRVPVGFWMKEDLVLEEEYYPRGGLKYLDRMVGWAADLGLYVIMDLHGGPGSQLPNEQFTGHRIGTPGFYTPENYERAIEFLEWMTQRIHSNKNYRTTGVLQVMNEPVHAHEYPTEAADMIQKFYPAAYTRIRAMERSLGVDPRHQLKIQYMGEAWGAGDPTSFLPANATDLLFDDHRYYKWDTSIKQTKDDYISAACSDDRGGSDIIIGEWSMGINDNYQSEPEFAIGSDAGVNLAEQKKWYQSFWAAQVQAFERSGGFVFWSYKCSWIGGVDEWRWCYQSAIANGVIPKNISSAISLSPCLQYR